MFESSVRALARAYFKKRIDTEQYRRKRARLIDDITEGVIGIEYRQIPVSHAAEASDTVPSAPASSNASAVSTPTDTNATSRRGLSGKMIAVGILLMALIIAPFIFFMTDRSGMVPKTKTPGTYQVPKSPESDTSQPAMSGSLLLTGFLDAIDWSSGGIQAFEKGWTQLSETERKNAMKSYNFVVMANRLRDHIHAQSVRKELSNLDRADIEALESFALRIGLDIDPVDQKSLSHVAEKEESHQPPKDNDAVTQKSEMGSNPVPPKTEKLVVIEPSTQGDVMGGGSKGAKATLQEDPAPDQETEEAIAAAKKEKQTKINALVKNLENAIKTSAFSESQIAEFQSLLTDLEKLKPAPGTVKYHKNKLVSRIITTARKKTQNHLFDEAYLLLEQVRKFGLDDQKYLKERKTIAAAENSIISAIVADAHQKSKDRDFNGAYTLLEQAKKIGLNDQKYLKEKKTVTAAKNSIISAIVADAHQKSKDRDFDEAYALLEQAKKIGLDAQKYLQEKKAITVEKETFLKPSQLPFPELINQHNRWALSQDPQKFTLQLGFFGNSDNLDKFKVYIDQHPVHFISFKLGSTPGVRVIYGEFIDREAAQEASEKIPQKMQSTAGRPAVPMSFKILQKQIKEAAK